MKTNEWTLKTVELCGRIAVLAELYKWGDIQDLINQHTLEAYKAGMTEAAEIAEKDESNPYMAQENITKSIRAARDSKNTV